MRKLGSREIKDLPKATQRLSETHIPYVLDRTSNLGSATLKATLRPEEDPLGTTNILGLKFLASEDQPCASLRV